MVNFGRMYSASRFAKSLVLNGFFAPLFKDRAAANHPQFVVFSSDLIGQGINFYGYWECEELTALSDWLEANRLTGGTMLDIGANIGNHGVFFSRMYRSVCAVEPNPKAFEVLSLNASLVPNMRCFPIAASDVNGSVRLLQEQTNVGHSRIVAEPGAHTVEVECWRLDDYFPDIEDLRLVKIDVEGHEAHALGGMRKLLERCSPVVLFEQQPEEFEDGKSPTIELLRSLGYTTFYSVDRVPSTNRKGIAGKFWFLLCSLAIGFRLVIRRRDVLEPAFYEMLIATKGAEVARATKAGRP